MVATHRMPPLRQPLSDGRWHFQHGPIDLVIGSYGEAAAVAGAHDAAWRRFATLLDELVAELPLLRQPVVAGAGAGAACPLRGVVARRMWLACRPHAADFITPMAAVAGAVAQEVVAAYARPGVRRAWVNNGGDIALHLAPGSSVRVGLLADVARVRPDAPALDGAFSVDAAARVRGIATSGWRGRSFSLGIADSVTVLAASAAAADAAATVIANAVDAGDSSIVRRPANCVKDDSDLGALLVTVDVPPLPAAVVRGALQRGAQCAQALRAAGLIDAAVLVCQRQQWRVMPAPPVRASSPSATGALCA